MASLSNSWSSSSALSKLSRQKAPGKIVLHELHRKSGSQMTPALLGLLNIICSFKIGSTGVVPPGQWEHTSVDRWDPSSVGSMHRSHLHTKNLDHWRYCWRCNVGHKTSQYEAVRWVPSLMSEAARSVNSKLSPASRVLLENEASKNYYRFISYLVAMNEESLTSLSTALLTINSFPIFNFVRIIGWAYLSKIRKPRKDTELDKLPS